MGMMMMCETRTMSSSPEALGTLETMIKWYRNAPAVILWSMGNEEWTLQEGPLGEQIVAAMVARSHELDPTRVCSAAGGRQPVLHLFPHWNWQERLGEPIRVWVHCNLEDVVLVRVEVLDSAGRHVPTADTLIHFAITGEGRFRGVGNGDPNCQESDQRPVRSLFNGLAQLIVQSTRNAGVIDIEAYTQP